EQEFNPQTGLRWRWLSEKGQLKVRSPHSVPLVLHLEGESPRKYFSKPSHLVVRAGEQMIFDQPLSADFVVDAQIPALNPGTAEQAITLETDQVFVAAERGWRRTADRRHLGLRIFKCELRQAP